MRSGTISPKLANQYDALMTVFLLLGMLTGLIDVVYVLFSRNWTLAMLTIAVDTCFVFGIVLVCYLRFGPALTTIQYWKVVLAQKGKLFPATLEERRKFRLWARGILEGKITAASDALLKVMEIRAELSLAETPLGEKQKRLRAAQQEAEKANAGMEKCQEFFFSSWPDGSGILADDDIDSHDREEAPTSPGIRELVV